MCCRKWGRLPAKGTPGWETVALGVKKVTLRPIRSAAGQLAGAGEACRLEAADGSLVRVRVRVQGGARVGTAAGDAGRWGAQTGRRARPAAPSPGRPAGGLCVPAAESVTAPCSPGGAPRAHPPRGAGAAGSGHSRRVRRVGDHRCAQRQSESAGGARQTRQPRRGPLGGDRGASLAGLGALRQLPCP